MDSQEPWRELQLRTERLLAAVEAIPVAEEMTAQHREAAGRALDEAAVEAEREVLPLARKLAGSPDASGAVDGAAALFRRMAVSNSWLDGRGPLTKGWLERALELARSPELRQILESEKRRVLDLEEFKDAIDLARRGKLGKARSLLLDRQRNTLDLGLRRRIEDFLAEPRNLVAPIKGPPSLVTFNGIGLTLCGRRNEAADGTYVATLCFAVIFIPLFPVRSYLVRSLGDNSWGFLGRVPLSAFARWWRRVVLIVPTLLLLRIFALEAYESSSYVQETRHLRRADEALRQGDPAQAVRHLMHVSSTRDEGRRARMDELARAALTRAFDGARTPQHLARLMAGLPTAPRAAWYPPEVARAMEETLIAVAGQAGGGRPCRDLLHWISGTPAELAGRKLELAARACAAGDDPLLLGAAARWHAEASRPCPPEVVRRLRGHLDRGRHETWKEDAQSYLLVADEKEAEPVVFALAEAAWKGETGPAPLKFKGPAVLKSLFDLDRENDLEKRATGLEGISDAGGLPEPQASWHRLGVARRLAEAYGALNEKDPVRFPVAKARPWAILAAGLAPGDAGLRTRAMRYLIEEGEYKRALELGEKAAADPKTAVWLGVAYSRLGREADAERVLQPRVAADLAKYVGGYEGWTRAVERRQESLVASLRNGTAEQSILRRLNALPSDRAREEASRWIQEKIGSDPSLRILERQWREVADVHSAALELALVELNLGRALPPGEPRQAKLREAERLFLELRKVDDGNPHQELKLGQVYFWLGKEGEGQEIFDRLEKEGRGPILFQMGQIYRDLGRMEASRRVLEAAYGRLPDPERKKVAAIRAITEKDNEDKLEWLGKADAGDPWVRAELAQARGQRFLEDGRFADARAPFEEGARYYAGRENSASLNNAALLHLLLARTTGDLAHLNEGQQLLRRAVEADQNDGIALGNYVSMLRTLGYTALAGTALRADLIHLLPDSGWMDYVAPPLPASEWAERAKAQAELRRASDLGTRAVILSPDRAEGYEAQYTYFVLTQDAAALRKFRELLEASPPKREESVERARARQRGERTPAERRAAEQGLATVERILPEVRKAGHRATLAYALAWRAGARLEAERAGIPGNAFPEAMKDVEEAAQVYDAPASWWSLGAYRAEAAARELEARDSDFAGCRREAPDANGSTLLALYAIKRPAAAEALRASPHVRGAAEAALKWMAARPGEPGFYPWIWLTLAGDPGADAVRQAMVKEGLILDRERIQRVLYPQSSDAVGESWLAARAWGDAAEEGRSAAHARRHKVLSFFFGE